MKIIKNKNKYLSCIQKQSYKIAVVLVVVSMFFSILNINQTFAYFSDKATIDGNTFTAGTLDLNVDKTDFGTVGLGVDKNLIISNDGSLPFEYGIEALFSETSDIAFCNQLNISVKEGENILYSGNILNINFTEAKILGTGENNGLVITITDPSDSFIGKTCNLQLASKAWQDELSYEQGFTDIAYTNIVINSEKEPTLTDGDVVLNEFLANPNGTQYGFNFGGDNSLMPQGEWIELYNNGDEDVNVDGWSIMNRTLAIKRLGHFDYDIEPVITTVVIDSSHTRDGNTIIPAHGWLVVYMNKEIISNYVGDITLYNSVNAQKDYIGYGAIVDHCYLSPTPGVINDNDPSSRLCFFGVPGNKSYARIPDGIGAWIDPIPTPGTYNELVEEIIPEEDTTEVITPDVQLETTDDATVTTDNDTTDTTTDNTGTTDTIVTDDTTTATTDADTTTTATTDQPAQAVDAIAPSDEEDPTVELVVTEPVTAVEPVVAPAEEIVESVEPEESPLSATLPEEIPPASPDEVVE